MMAGFNRKDWEDLNITKEEVENLSQALKKEEFRKLLSEYAEEITDPRNRKQYQDDIIQLEAERGIDCTFVNPEPGFVVKTSVDGNKKAFINICQNKAVGRPSSKPEFKENARGLSWSIPLCQAPGREDFDKKKNRCVVYDVIFHPDTLHMAGNNPQFKKVVIETALNAVEESYNVNLDKKNFKLPKLKFKGLPFATVIRKKSKHQPVLTEEDTEFFSKIKYPLKPPNEENPVVRNFENKKEVGKYTIPKYIIKHRSDIDLQEFTYNKNAKINAAIPKQLVIEVNLPLLNSTQTVTLDIMEKSLHLLCEKPAKYKLDIQLPYGVDEEAGNAKFDKDRRLLIITLPVKKAKTTIKDLLREDSGVESDLSPVGSVTNNSDFVNTSEDKLNLELQDSCSLVKENDAYQNEFQISEDESNKVIDDRTTETEFLEPDKHYLLPGFSCNVDDDNICFVLNVKNVDSTSLEKKIINFRACHIKFVSIGSGFFPVHYAFYIDFKEECSIENVTCDIWDNNVTLLINLVKNDKTVTKYHVGLCENTLKEHFLSSPVELKKLMDEALLINDVGEDTISMTNFKVKTANVNEVVISIIPEESTDFDGLQDRSPSTSSLVAASEIVPNLEEKSRTLSESGVDQILASGPIIRKSILKKRISRSLSESNADDYFISSSMEKTISESSDFGIHEEPEIPYIKKTVRFSEKIRKQLFRANSSILARKNKNKKKSRNKKRAMERRLSESENSELEDKESNKKTRKSKKTEKNKMIEVISNSNKQSKNEACEAVKDVKKKEKTIEEQIPKLGLKKDDKIFEFKSDLIFGIEC